MEFSVAKLALIALVLLSFFLLWIAISAFRKNKFFSSWLLSFLAGHILTVFLLNFEIYFLSLLPFDRPLRFIGMLHVLLCLTACIYCYNARSLFKGKLIKIKLSITNILSFLALFSFLLVFLLIFLYGPYSMPVYDEVGYHIPLAVQPYQDGTIDRLYTWLPWTEAYP